MFFRIFALGIVLIKCVSCLSIDSLMEGPVADLVGDVVFTNTCISDLGCFYTGLPFYRPGTRFLPYPPIVSQIKATRFLLFTPSNKKKEYILEETEESLTSSPFDATQSTKIIIHGYISDVTIDATQLALKDALLEQGNYNVIIVDWGKANKDQYDQSAANGRVVGAQVAHLIQFLGAHTGISPQSVHLIGHSLGAQVAGWVGERIRQPKIYRITGLDPAGPYFDGSDVKVRLDPSDADFVDCIHTTGSEVGVETITALGTRQSLGHMDFYPNGGLDQPSCNLLKIGPGVLLDEILRFVENSKFLLPVPIICGHLISMDYYIQSVSGKYACTGAICTSYEDYINGDCKNKNDFKMGYFANPPTRTMEGQKIFVKVEEEPPYCPVKKVSRNRTAPKMENTRKLWSFLNYLLNCFLKKK